MPESGGRAAPQRRTPRIRVRRSPRPRSVSSGSGQHSTAASRVGRSRGGHVTRAGSAPAPIPRTYSHPSTPTGGPALASRVRSQVAAREAMKAAKAAKRQSRVQGALQRVRAANAKTGALSHYTADDAAALQKRIGASNTEARALSTKVMSESSGNPRAIGHDPGGSTGLGLWQITTGSGPEWASARERIARFGGEAAMLKPAPNAKAALDLYRSSSDPLGNWYGASGPPGDPSRGRAGVRARPKKRDVGILRKNRVPVPRPKKGAAAPRADHPHRKPGPWAGAQKAVLSKIPQIERAEGRGDKRTPAENSSVGGAADSDHLTTNLKAYAADIPVNPSVYHHIQQRLGLPQTATGEQTVVKNGYRYQLIYGSQYGHGDHIHLGAEWVGSGIPPGTSLGGPSGGGSSSGGGLSNVSSLTSSGGGNTSAPSDTAIAAYAKKHNISIARARRIAEKRPEDVNAILNKIHSIFKGHDVPGATVPVGLADLERRYGKGTI